MSLIFLLHYDNEQVRFIAKRELGIAFGFDKLGNFTFYKPQILLGQFLSLGYHWQLHVLHSGIKLFQSIPTIWLSLAREQQIHLSVGDIVFIEKYKLLILKNNSNYEISTQNDLSSQHYVCLIRLGKLKKVIAIPNNSWVTIGNNRQVDILLPIAFDHTFFLKLKITTSMICFQNLAEIVSINGQEFKGSKSFAIERSYIITIKCLEYSFTIEKITGQALDTIYQDKH